MLELVSKPRTFLGHLPLATDAPTTIGSRRSNRNCKNHSLHLAALALVDFHKVSSGVIFVETGGQSMVKGRGREVFAVFAGLQQIHLFIRRGRPFERGKH
jgi:hypothetical protein